MLCEKIIGNLSDGTYGDATVEYVDIDWYDAFTKIHKKTTKEGTEVGIRLDNEVLKKGMRQDDVLYAENGKVIAVNIPPCEVIEVTVSDHHPEMIAKVCYEIGNRHATLFWGDNDHTFSTPYNEPTCKMLSDLHGVKTEVKTIKLDFTKSISSSINKHTH